MRFSGHETFPFRYAWLPKAFKAICTAPDALADDERAMELLGLGKNMVNATRFWLEVTDVARSVGGRKFEPTDLGRAVLGSDGYDPFLEDERTLWLLHWHIASQKDDPLFAWDFLLNHWQHPELCRSEVLAAFQRAAPAQPRPLSAVTLGQHLDVFLRSYLPPRGRAVDGDEDVLDCPLAALDLIEHIGERQNGAGRAEPVFRFRREPKPDITPGLFAYCIDHYWSMRHDAEQTLSFRQLAVAPGSPGQLLKLPEDDLRVRLERMEHDTRGALVYRASAAHPVVVRGHRRARDLLPSVYAEAAGHA